jgi:hypothetical protein
MSLKLEVGRYYKTRDGRKVGPMRWTALYDGNARGSFEGKVDGDADGLFRRFHSDGSRPPNQSHQEYSIVAEWTDEQDANVAESELERLVRVANEGTRAKRELRAKYKGQWENTTVQHGQMLLDADHWTDKDKYVDEVFRIKPRPAFEPFGVGPADSTGYQNWRVSLSDDGKELSVGCQKFDAQWAHQLLIDFCKRDCNMSQKGGREIYAGRKGISINGSTLSWPDADRILAALEAYFAKEKS